MNEACEQKQRCSVSVGDACSHSTGFGRFRYIRRHVCALLLLQQLGLWYFKMYGASNASAKDMRGNIVVYGLSHSNYKNIEYPVKYGVHLLPPAQQQRIISLVRSLSPPPNLYISFFLSPVGIPLHWPETPIPTRRNIFGWSVPNSLIHPPTRSPGPQNPLQTGFGNPCCVRRDTRRNNPLLVSSTAKTNTLYPEVKSDS